MPKFYYTARIKTGVLVHGEIDAVDPWLARKALTAQNMIVLEINNRFSAQAFLMLFKTIKERYFRRISIEDKLMFVNQFETGVSIGIPIIQVLDFVRDQVSNKHLKEAIGHISKDVSQGSTVYKAIEKHPHLFDNIYIGLIRTGEVSGTLEGTLSRLAKIIEQQVQNRAKIKTATFYPKIVMVFMVVVSAIIITFVIPKFKSFLNSLGADLPLITQYVLATSDFFVHYWYLILIGGFGIYSGFTAYVTSVSGKLQYDRFKLRLPLLGVLFMELELNNFCILLDLLLASGMTLFESFETLKTTQSNQVVRNEIDRCAEEVRAGGSLASGLRGGKVFPPAFNAMVSIGEESGMLPKVLQKLGRYYQIQVDYKLDNLSKLLEPILLTFIFFLLGILLLAVFLPIWKMSSAVHSAAGR